MFRLITTIILSIILQACATPLPKATEESTSLVDSSSFWAVRSVFAGPVDDEPVLRMKKHMFEIYTECFIRKWVYYFVDGAVEINNLAESGYYCEKESSPTIEKLDQALLQATSATIRNDQLNLFDELGRRVLEADRLHPSGLEYIDWVIVSYFDGKSLVRFPDPQATRMLFVHGHLMGSPGCGDFAGSGYSLDGSHITFDGLTVILLGWCTEEHVKYKGFVVGALSKVRRFERAGKKIELYDQSGQLQVVLAPFENL